MKISRAAVHSPRMSASARLTCLPGREPRTSSSLEMTTAERADRTTGIRVERAGLQAEHKHTPECVLRLPPEFYLAWRRTVHVEDASLRRASRGGAHGGGHERARSSAGAEARRGATQGVTECHRRVAFVGRSSLTVLMARGCVAAWVCRVRERVGVSRVARVMLSRPAGLERRTS